MKNAAALAREQLKTSVISAAKEFGWQWWVGSKVRGNKHHPTSVSFYSYVLPGKNGIVVQLGVDPALNDNVRTQIWAEDGRKLVEALEARGFNVDRKAYGTDRDFRTFLLLAA